jgi:hypothetical protein
MPEVYMSFFIRFSITIGDAPVNSLLIRRRRRIDPRNDGIIVAAFRLSTGASVN